MRLVKRQEVAKTGGKDSKKDGEETTGREEKEKEMAIRWEKKGGWLLSLGRDWSCTIWLSRVGGEFQDWSLPEDGHSSHLRSELPPFTLTVLPSSATQEWAVTVKGITNEGLSHDCECIKCHISSEKSQSVVKFFTLRLKTHCPFKQPKQNYLIQLDPLFRHSGFWVL